jgi:hypothetical protein
MPCVRDRCLSRNLAPDGAVIHLPPARGELEHDQQDSMLRLTKRRVGRCECDVDCVSHRRTPHDRRRSFARHGLDSGWFFAEPLRAPPFPAGFSPFTPPSCDVVLEQP